jgi:hypothetical protein
MSTKIFLNKICEVGDEWLWLQLIGSERVSGRLAGRLTNISGTPAPYSVIFRPVSIISSNFIDYQICSLSPQPYLCHVQYKFFKDHDLSTF